MQTTMIPFDKLQTVFAAVAADDDDDDMLLLLLMKMTTTMIIMTMIWSFMPLSRRWKGYNERFLFFVLRFYGPVNPKGSCRAQSVYLTTHFLGRLSPLSG